MGQVLHGSARTTEAVRRAIQHSQENLRALAVSELLDAASDTAAGSAGVTIGQFYRTGNVVKVRLS